MEECYVLIAGFDEYIEDVVGPFKTESDAMLAKNTLGQLGYEEGDKWMNIQRREMITL